MAELEKPTSPLSNDECLERFFEWLEEKGIEPYDHQEEAILELFADRNVILNTPTGSGKSLVALAVHFRGLCLGRRSYYTVPIKALANEKFLSLSQTFGADNVGLVTGDATVNGDAPIICCTAEILANLALREGDTAKVQDVVIDEFHYYSDRDRGISWQLPLLTLPQARFCLMSATIGDTTRFQNGLTELTKAETTLVQSDQRPVPLEFNYSENPLEETVAELVTADRAPVYLVHFTQNTCAQSAQNLLSYNFTNKEERAQLSELTQDTSFSTPYGKEIARFIRAGIGIHHAGLLPKYRILIEKLAQQGLLKVICGTDTLGVGVNVPIRSVLFTQLCKYDGEKTRILTVRDFQQICGRAGRRGFDNIGYVYAQAPAHVIENKVGAQKAAEKVAKGKKGKFVKKAAPDFGYVHWDENTFQHLISANPEELKSSFKLRQSMLLNVLSREHEDGCLALKEIISASHESESGKKKLRQRARHLFRGLIEGKVLSIIPVKDRSATGKKLALNVDLQEDFSLNQSLALWLLETLTRLDKEAIDYSLQVLSLIEAILEDPQIILRMQTKKARDAVFQELKDEGVSYEERMERLDEVEYPKPGKEFIYLTYNEFVEKNSWLKEDSIRPKSICREVFEDYYDFNDYVKTYKLERSEGILLRHISEVYKVLTQTIPPNFVTAEITEAIQYFEEILLNTDSSLIEEWEKLKNPDYDAAAEQAKKAQRTQQEVPFIKRKGLFEKAVHEVVLKFLKAFREEDWTTCFELIQKNASNGAAWTQEYLEDYMDDYLDEFELFRIDPEARNKKHLRLVQKDETLIIEQTLVDPEEELNWQANFQLPLNEVSSREDLKLIFNGLNRI